MSYEEPSPVFQFDNSDPEMQQAYANARSTFRYFWRELAWEARRIVPGLDLAVVKAPFYDSLEPGEDGEDPDVEHMWIAEIEFDGKLLTGVLMNSPNTLESVSEGDTVQKPLGEISDWMYAIGGEVFGAHSVQVIRAEMDRATRQAHDGAWGLRFGDPASVRLVPDLPVAGGFLARLFKKREPALETHPMSEAMAESLRDSIAQDSSFVSSPDERGWTLLHHQALAGCLPTVEVLLAGGADPAAVTNHGMTPRDLADSLGWERVAGLLANA